MKGDAKSRKWGGLQVVMDLQGHWKCYLLIESIH